MFLASIPKSSFQGQPDTHTLSLSLYTNFHTSSLFSLYPQFFLHTTHAFPFSPSPHTPSTNHTSLLPFSWQSYPDIPPLSPFPSSRLLTSHNNIHLPSSPSTPFQFSSPTNQVDNWRQVICGTLVEPKRCVI